MKKGLIQVYCGNGKGKTTAATGLAIRAAGNGFQVLFVQFMKDGRTGEFNIMKKIPEIEVIHLDKNYGFAFNMTDEQKKEARKAYSELWEIAMKKIVEGSYDLFVADEFMSAYQHGLIDREAAVHFLKNKPEGLEVVLTGRHPAKEVEELADYISEINKIKHPMDRGIPARIGIEF